MAEVAELVLSGIPIAIWVLEKYAEPVSASQNYPIAISTLRASLILQKRQLELTLENIGLKDPDPQELRECFREKFPSICEELCLIVRRMDSITAELLESLQVDVSGKPLWSADAPERIKWEWRKVRQCLGTKRSKQFVDDLQGWNDALRRCVEISQVPIEDETRKVENLKRCFNLKRRSLERDSFKSLYRALGAGLKCTCRISHQAAIELDWVSRSELGSFPCCVFLSFAEGRRPDCSWRKLSVKIEDGETRGSKPTVLSQTACVHVAPQPPQKSTKRRHRLLHIKEYLGFPPPKFEKMSQKVSQTVSQPTSTASTQPRPKFSTIESLCEEVRKECLAWELAGILHDPDNAKTRAFSIFNPIQEEPAIPLRNVSLRWALFAEQPGALRQIASSLSAKERYGIAAALTWSVFYLSGSPWLSESFGEDQVQIFIDKNAARETFSWHLRSSCSLSGAPTSVSAIARDASATNFQHLIPNQTIFDLGVLLIELCINRRIQERQGDSSSRPMYAYPASIVETYEAALSHLDEVYRLAGDSYGYAAERCIKFSFQGRDVTKDFEFSQFRQQFHDAVIAPVQATYQIHPGSVSSVVPANYMKLAGSWSGGSPMHRLSKTSD